MTLVRFVALAAFLALPVCVVVAQEPAVPPPVAAESAPAASAAPAPDPALAKAIQDAERAVYTVVVTPTRNAGRLFDTPYAGTTKGRDTLNRSRILQDALRGEPGAVVQRTSYGQSSPFLRNLTGYHTLLLVDGIRLNNSVFRSGPNEYWGTVDALSTEQLEVVMGPGSVLYGSDAAGGTVNAIPRSRKEYGESSWERRFFVRYAGAENSLLGRVEVSGNVEDVFGFVVGGTGGSFGDVKAGGDVDRQVETGYSTQFGDARFDVHLDDHWSLGILTQGANLNGIGRQHRTFNGVSYHGSAIGNDRRHDLDFERYLDAIKLEGMDLDGIIDRVLVRASFQRLEEDLDRVRNNGAREKQGFEVDTFGFGLELASELSFGRLTYGADFYHDDVESYRRNFNAAGTITSIGIQGPVGDDADYDLLGVFLQAEIPLGAAFDFIAGGRFTYAAADADGVQDPLAPANEISIEDSWTAVVGSARLVFKASDAVRLYGGVSQAFRAPNLSDLTRLDIALANELEVPSPDLDPESFTSFEIGGKVATGGFAADAAYWYMILDDLVIRRPTALLSGTNTIVLKSNDGDGHLQGIEARASYEFDGHWTVAGSFSWTDGQLDAFPTVAPDREREVFTRLSPIQGTLSLRWQTEDGAFFVKPWVLFVAAQDRLSSQDLRDTQRIPPDGSPGYTIYNLEAGYQFDPKKRLFLSVENLGDKNYRVHGSGVQEPGLNIIVGFDLTF